MLVVAMYCSPSISYEIVPAWLGAPIWKRHNSSPVAASRPTNQPSICVWNSRSVAVTSGLCCLERSNSIAIYQTTLAVELSTARDRKSVVEGRDERVVRPREVELDRRV